MRATGRVLLVQMRYSCRKLWGAARLAPWHWRCLHDALCVQLRLPHQSSRPDTRPSRTAAQLWWRYAYKAVTNQLRQGRPSWTDIVHYLRVQREYVPRYVSRLKDGLAAAQADETIARLEQDLPSMVRLALATARGLLSQRAAICACRAMLGWYKPGK